MATRGISTLQPMIDRITSVINAFTKWIEANKSLVTSVAAMVGTSKLLAARAATALRGNQMEQRMLTVTQEIKKHTKKTAELLKDGDIGSMEF